MSELTRAEQYRQQEKQAEYVDVTAPSGRVYGFEKPSVFEVLFKHDHLPQTASNTAVQEWIDAGVLKPDQVDEDKIAKFEASIRLRDRVLELSHDPKLVVGPATNPNELSTDDVSDADNVFLFRWVASGGVDANGVATFPSRPATGSVSGTRRKKRRS